jgi:Fe-S-cluster containining protein
MRAAANKIARADYSQDKNTELISLDLDIHGDRIVFQVSAGCDEANLADIVPLARMLSTKINEVVLNNVRRNGHSIACCKGCSTCCDSYIIPLSVPEVFRLNDEILTLPENQRDSVTKAFLHAACKILNNKPPDFFISRTKENNSSETIDLNLLSNWYRSLQLVCPFLDDNVCSIYEHRPLTCREHYVTGSVGQCKETGISEGLLAMPVRVSSALGRLAAELEGTGQEAVLLPLAMAWCEKNRNRERCTWPFNFMVGRFFEIIREMSRENSTTGCL